MRATSICVVLGIVAIFPVALSVQFHSETSPTPHSIPSNDSTTDLVTNRQGGEYSGEQLTSKIPRSDKTSARSHSLSEEELEEMYSRGEEISSFQARLLERVVAADIDNDQAVAQLLAYYHHAAMRDQNYDVRPWCDLIIRLIDTRPEFSLLAYTAYPVLISGERKRVEASWQSQISRPDASSKVLSNAGGFFMTLNTPLSIEIYRRLKEMEPKNPRWSYWIALLLTSKRNKSEKEIAHDLQLSYEEAMRSLSLESNPMEIDSLRSFAAERAFDAGDYSQAKVFAREVVMNRGISNTQALHESLQTLGRTALREGDLQSALRYLDRSLSDLSTTANVTVRFSLARELLASRQTDEVLAYLRMARGISYRWTREEIEDHLRELQSTGTAKLRGP